MRYRFRFDPSRAGMTKVLGPLEALVMETLWNRGPSTVAEVHAPVRERRGVAYTTVLTILSRLKEKGLVERTQVGNSHVYSAVISRDEFTGKVVEDVADGLLEAFSQPALAYFARRLREKEETPLKEMERLPEKRAKQEED